MEELKMTTFMARPLCTQDTQAFLNMGNVFSTFINKIGNQDLQIGNRVKKVFSHFRFFLLLYI